MRMEPTLVDNLGQLSRVALDANIRRARGEQRREERPETAELMKNSDRSPHDSVDR